MSYWAANLLVLGGLSFGLYKVFAKEVAPWLFWSALLIKLTAGLVVGWIFGHYYGGGDTFLFFEKAVLLAAEPFPTYIDHLFSPSNYDTTQHPRIVFFSKLLSPLALLSGGSYWLASLYLSWISFAAFLWVAVRMGYLFPAFRSLAFVCFLCIPTVVFWSSGILKDGLASAAFSLCIIQIISAYKGKKVSTVALLSALFSLYLLWKLKPYLLIMVLGFAGLISLFQLLARASFRKKILWVVLGLFALVAVQEVHPYLTLDRLPLTLFENNQSIAKNTLPSQHTGILLDGATWKDVLPFIPQALHTGLLRPSLFDTLSPLAWPHRIENFLLTVLLVLSLLIAFQTQPSIGWRLMVPAIACIGILAMVLALATPNFGTLVRYKSAFMPFLFYMSALLPYQHLVIKAKE